MTDEQMREICKSYSYGMTLGEIANLENLTVEQVQEAVVWGTHNRVFDDLQAQSQYLKGDDIT